MNKNLFNPKAILILSSLLIFACKKEKVDTSPSNISKPSSGMYDNFPDNLNRSLTSNLVNEDGNEEDTKMNSYLLELAQGLASFGAETDLMKIIYANLDDNGEVKYSKLIALDSRFLILMNDYLKPNCFPTRPTGHDCYKEIDDNMMYKHVDYYPSLVVLNSSKLNPLKRPVMCIGAEINEADNIMGLKVNEDGSVTTTIVSESQARNSSIPVIIMTNGTDHIEIGNDEITYSSSYDPSTPTPAFGTNVTYEWTDWQIHGIEYRYEGLGKSEVKHDFAFYDATSSAYVGPAGSFGGGNELSIKIDDVPKAAVIANTLFSGESQSVYLGTISAASMSTYRYLYNVIYEYDWWATGKITVCTPPSIFASNPPDPGNHKPKMKYSNEWYCLSFCHIDQLSTFPTPGVSWSNFGLKARFTFKRTN